MAAFKAFCPAVSIGCLVMEHETCKARSLKSRVRAKKEPQKGLFEGGAQVRLVEVEIDLFS